MSLLFLTYGPTHSGKTTFGARLREAMGESAKFIHIDNDVVDEFIKENYNNLRTDAEVLARRTPRDPDLRLRIPQLIAGYALGEGYSVIATAAHPRRVIRQSYYDIAKANGAQVVLLLFRVSDEQAAQRIQKNGRDTAILDISPHGGAHFQELFEKQKAILEEPSAEERQACFKLFEVTEDNVDVVLKAAQGLIGHAAAK
jgi:tRNA A37 N6-isopentenylltransferase MiaA